MIISSLLRRRRSRGGYVFLLSVLVIGAIATEMAFSLILLGLAAGQSSLSLTQSVQAYEYAQTCAEQAFQSLRADVSYDGGVLVNFSGGGTCSVRHTGGSGNADRTLCIEGRSGRVVRRLEIAIVEVYPAMKVDSWKEVGEFGGCP